MRQYFEYPGAQPQRSLNRDCPLGAAAVLHGPWAVSFGSFPPFFVAKGPCYGLLSQVENAPEIHSPLHHAPMDNLG